MKIGPYMDPEKRLMLQVSVSDDGCWNWIGTISKSGYGKFMLNRRHMRAHRAAYLLFEGEIPERHQVHHTCRNKACVNPEHLDCHLPKDHKILDGHIYKPFCCRGHAMTPDNFYVSPGSNSRHCKTCGRLRTQRWRQENIERVRERGRISDAKRRPRNRKRSS